MYLGVTKEMKRIQTIAATVCAVSVLASAASAATITSLDANGEVLATAPTSVTNAAPVNSPLIQGFNEQTGVSLLNNLTMENYTAADTSAVLGTVVDSHMFFINQESGKPDPLVTTTAEFSFSETILGVITSLTGLDNTDSIFGASGTTYEAGFTARGLEGNDAVSFSGNTLTLTFAITQPGDWVRVITASSVPAVPLPAGAPLLLAGLGAFGWMRRRQAKKA